jgi:hypothetical protein
MTHTALRVTLAARATAGPSNVLGKAHMDEQFLARRNLRDLPGTIERLTQRLEGLNPDQATMQAHDDITIGGHETGDPVAALSWTLDNQLLVMQTRRVPLGTYRGLRFGMVLHPQCRPEVYLAAAALRAAPSRVD